MKHKICITASILALQMAVLSSCAGSGGFGGIEGRIDTAQSIAQKSGLNRHDFDTPNFILASWQRMGNRAEDVHIYIEGDGLAWLDKRTPSLNPTPKTPIAMELAAADTGENVVYIARPCQFVPLGDAVRPCPDVYWRSKRFAAEVINSYDHVLTLLAEQRKREFGIDTRFHLIGYSGGANIAGILAAKRDNVKSLRTVAGNVDNDYFTQYHGVSPMPQSLNMADSATTLKSIPQYHFVGGQDETVPIDIYKSYEGRLGTTSSVCSQYKIIDQNTHTKGWDDIWSSLLSLPVKCN